MSELKACPFCGCDSADFMPDRLIAPGAHPPVFCNECHASAMDAAAWNRRADDWQPIATAPRDCEVEVWNGMTGVYRSQFTNGQWPMGFWGYLGEWFPHATHWRPLPEGPMV